ncbi:MAG TPA: alpha-amylase family glycosyl hydrolase [Candidatus Limnocylindrales bacterium]|nr:alpha-amylase family glycosyl hydrolase [Candidatus Limnocylindrales bacterium]
MKVESPGSSISLKKFLRHAACAVLMAGFSGLASNRVQGEGMLELFQNPWSEITQKMPEIAEAGYDSLWLPNPAKGNSGGYSAGYDVFDPFDLGNTNQQGTIATHYGTEDQLIEMVQTAHRFGIRVYFDDVMNHRSTTVPGNGVPMNYYPGLLPQDFHVQVVSNGYVNWSDVSDWCNPTNVERNPLVGLCDLAQEPGMTNLNFGSNYLGTTLKPVFIRFPGRPDLYMDTNGPLLGAGSGTGWPSPPNGYGPLNGWHPFDGHGQPVPEDVSTYLCRAVAWTLYVTKCDGFRLDAVKHVPVNFFGNETGQTDDPSFGGYTGAIQAMYDYVHGYGSNDVGNGYVEIDGNRNSLFNTESPRNDAMLFGEYEQSALPLGEDFYDYLNSGMRLCNFPLYNQFNNNLNNYGGGAGLYGMDSRDYTPTTSQQGNCDSNGNFSPAQAVNLPMDQDPGFCCPANEALEDSYYFMHEGLPMVYSDGFNHNTTNNATPIISYANYLGEFGDNSMPDTMYTHNQLARGGTRSRWSDQNIIAFERYDYRDVDPPSQYNNAYTNPAATVVLYAMNDDFGNPGDIAFDDRVSRTSDGYYLVGTNTASGLNTADVSVPNARTNGMIVGFPPGTLLTQLSSSGDVAGGGRDFYHLLVHGATTSLSTAQATANDPNPVNRLIYVNTTPPAGGGAIEMLIPSGGWVMYGIQWPQPSRANTATNAIVFRQGGVQAPNITIYRTDGTNGDSHFDPAFPFKMRGGVDPYTGQPVVAPNEGNVSNLTYAINIPVVTNAPFDILVRSDASTSNTLVKLDGGIDLNSQMGLGPIPQGGTTGLAPTNFLDLRDNPPGYADDRFLGYEQTAFQFRNGPEKFAARNVLSNNIVSLGAETYYYTVGGADTVIPGSGFGAGITNQTANWVYHDPAAAVTVLTNANVPVDPASQMAPTNPASGQSVDIWVKVGYSLQINTCTIYYTTDGSNPEGAFGVGKGTTQVAQAHWVNNDSSQGNVDWWKGTIPGQNSDAQVRYKVALFSGGSYGFAVGSNANWPSIQPISYAEASGSKLFGLTQAAITNFNPANAVVWLHNDLNPANTTVGLQSGFHIVRARTYLPVSNYYTNQTTLTATTPQNYVYASQAQVYNTYLQTFYYDGGPPGGLILNPPNDGVTISNFNYTFDLRADSTVSSVQFNIQTSFTNYWDIYTHSPNGIGNDTNGNPIFVSATPVTPNPGLNLQYPNYPEEFQFNFADVPYTGTAAVTVRLNDYATSVYTNEFTTLTRTVNTVAPQQMVVLSSPANNNTIVTLNSSNLVYLIQACFGTGLASAVSNFDLTINGSLQPQASYIIRPINYPGCPGMNSLLYQWNVTNVGTYLIQAAYTNGLTLSDSKTVIVAPPFQITSLANAGANPLIMWGSTPGANYQVLYTTNLTQPFQPLGPVIMTNGFSASLTDTSPPAPQKFYEIEIVP